MNPERFQEVEKLYHAARELEPNQRSAFLAEACGGDEELRREVESLLAHDPAREGMLDRPAAGLLEESAVPALTAGAHLGPYRIEAPIGAGGMGEVYRAIDTRLGRVVAIKTLHQKFSDRFEREAHAISALNHPHICTLHDIGPNYLVMELVEGETLAALLSKGPLPIDSALRYGGEIADALGAAHAKGIIHRDLKPGNVMVTQNGVKVLDFGLVKRFRPMEGEDAATATRGGETGPGRILGTVAYMSPEQAEGRPLDERSDIFALGVVLYEMLCGKRPFRGESTLSTMASILREDPQTPRQLRPETPRELERIILHCLTKKPEERYARAVEVARDLEQLRKPVGIRFTPRTRMVAAAATCAVLGVLGAWWYLGWSRAGWAQTQALPQAAQLVDRSRPMAALRLVRQAERYVPSSPEVIRLKEDVPLFPMTIQTTPAGAEIYATDYTDPMAADFTHWEHLGRSPLRSDRLPHRGNVRLLAVKDGFEPVEWAVYNSGGATATVQIPLHTKAETPPGMVWIPVAPPTSLVNFGVQVPAAQIPAAWMDKYEVTNRQFKEFVDAGGYQKRQYWKQPFVKNSKSLTWEEAMAAFRDATGRPGPSTWEAGTYPDGKADFPVGGVSWYEAAAYAEFANKSLPTLYHWVRAAGFGISSQIVSVSNFSSQGATRAGANLGLAAYGTYDMAGNVKEWTANPSGEKRYILGGGWNELSYAFELPDAQFPFERDPTFGFRCVRYASEVSELLKGPVATVSADRRSDKPADDRTFQVFKSLLSYDKTDLNASVDSVTDAPHWRREKIGFQAAYGNERMNLYLYLPKAAAPPYQAVFYFGGASMFFARAPEAVSTRLMEYLVKSGRAVALPAYAGTLDRGPTPLNAPPGRWRDLLILGFKDLARSIDYLETRNDIDTSKLGYYGVSNGTEQGLIVLGVENRFKAAVFMSAGSDSGLPAEADTWNYAPRVKIPVLMLNGQDDFILPVEASQDPIFKALGTPEKDKRHIVYPGGHVDYIDRQEVVKEALDWMDRYLGPVRK
jgi:eukaryotic-like serine/threonine-protein kinase